MTPQSFSRAGQFVVGVGIARLLSALLLLPQSLRVPSSGKGRVSRCVSRHPSPPSLRQWG
jgi:hypothetical protein